MTKVIMRPDKNGGITPCRSPEDKIGKGRCTHLLEVGSVDLIYNKEERCYYVDISNSTGEKMSITAKREQIEKFIKSLEDAVDEETKIKIVEFLRKRR